MQVAPSGDAKAWIQYALAREGCVELATAIFPTQSIFDSVEKMYNLPDLDYAPIQARAAAQKMRLQYLRRWTVLLQRAN